MRRHLFTFTSALSLLLWVLTVSLWVRSYWGGDGSAVFIRRGLWTFVTAIGRRQPPRHKPCMMM